MLRLENNLLDQPGLVLYRSVYGFGTSRTDLVNGCGRPVLVCVVDSREIDKIDTSHPQLTV